MKIIYISRNNVASQLQMQRIVEELRNNDHTVKVMGYNLYLTNELIDWDISALECFSNEDATLRDQLIKEILTKQVKKFNPDVILSDLNTYYSKLCKELNYPVWQISEDFLSYFITKDMETNKPTRMSFKRYRNVLRGIEENTILTDFSDRFLIYSPFADIEHTIQINPKYEWCRSYFKTSNANNLCKYKFMGIEVSHRKQILNFIEKENENDSIIYNRFFEHTNNIKNNMLNNYNDYNCNLFNSEYIICEGFTSHISDAVYNNKKLIIVPNLFEIETIINAYYCNYFNVGQVLFEDFEMDYDLNNGDIKFNSNVKFLHTLLKDL